MLVLQHHLNDLLLLVAHQFHLHLVARTILGQSLLKVGKLVYILVVDTHDDVIHADVCTGCRATFSHFAYQQSIDYTKLLASLLLDVAQTLARLVGHLRVARFLYQRGDGYTQLDALHSAILHEVGHYLLHDAGRNGKAVTRIRACRREEGGIDTHQFAGGIHQCTATVSLVDGSIGLDVGLDALLAILLSHAQATRLGTDNTCRHRRGEVEGITHGQYPFAHLQSIRVTHRNGGEIVTLDFQQGQVGLLVGADDASFQLAVVVERHTDLVSTSNHVIVGHDVAIGLDDDTRTETGALRGLHLPALCAAASAKEFAEEVREWVLDFHFLHLGALGGTDVHHRMHRFLCRYGQIHRLRLSS